MQVVDDHMGIETARCKTDVTIRAHQDESVTLDTIEMIGVAIDVKPSSSLF